MLLPNGHLKSDWEKQQALVSRLAMRITVLPAGGQDTNQNQT